MPRGDPASGALGNGLSLFQVGRVMLLTNDMRFKTWLSLMGLTGLLIGGWATMPPGPSANEIVRRSVVNNDHNWDVAPRYTYLEKDVIVKNGKKTVRSYEDLMIAGWPYQKLVAEDGVPLPPARARAEEKKLQQETFHRQHESEAKKEQQIEAYLRERRQDHELMQQMMKAFDFKLLGQDTVNGHRCYLLQSTPRSDYRPINRDTQVLKSMRGRLWVDADEYQWVKVHAEVFRPVTFGLFIAHVQPGTEFTLEEGPVGDGIWMPTHFVRTVKANILFFWSRNSSEEDTYWDYRRTDLTHAARRQGGTPRPPGLTQPVDSQGS